MTARARASWMHALLLVAAGAGAAMLAIELGVRLATGTLLNWESKEAEDCCSTDPMVGRLIRKTGKGRHPTEDFTMTVGAHGIRLNGESPPAAEGPVTLAVGDSFAFGDGVDDEHTWPAVVERLSRGRVINAGMIGFGLDQAVLRAEQLIDVFHPGTIVIAFIPHDVLRCEMSYWSGFSKPYFTIEPSGLQLHPAEVPTPPRFASVRKILSGSLTLDILFPRFLHWQGPESLRVHERGTEVACLLMERLAALGRARAVRIVLLAHPQEPNPPPDQVKVKDAVLACATANQLEVLDVFGVIEALPVERRAALFDRHFTVEGYRLVGEEVARFLQHPS